MTLNTSLGCVLLPLLVWVIYVNTRTRKGNLPPGPKGYPIVGNTFQLDQKRPWHTFAQWKEVYGVYFAYSHNADSDSNASLGDIVHFRLFNQDVILLNSAKAAGDLLDRRASNYSQRPRSVVAEYMTGGMLLPLMNPGARLRSMQRAVHEALNIRASTRYYPIQMREGIRLAMDILESPERCYDHVHRYTSSETASIIYNSPPLESSQDPLIAFLANFVDVAAQATAPGAYLANYIPILEHLPDFLSKWKRTCKEIYRYHAEKFLGFFLNIKEKMLQNQDVGSSFCSMLIETHDRHGLDDNTSSWLAAVLYLAGYETTASCMGWLILAMVYFPEVQRKAQEELDRVIGRTRIPTMEDMGDLPYMRAVVKEVLRWRPPTPMSLFHASLEDDIYEGYFIPKNSYIIPNILAMNHDTATYGPDTDEFRPERFLNDDGTHKPSPFDTKDEGHYAYGFGRRICPGRHLASNAVFIFTIALWAVRLKSGSEALSTKDEGSGIFSHPPSYRITSMPRFPEALDILRLAKEEWL
ncbi:cytochrome p450 [Moniliophthora roreri MCA 2997]|uniref:Cytochrome p450 n=1 Tax=Moniliophthora roreri (strain MCA 2997) TaxID=1381753 RepID=V2X6P4_MONRO|nr:cytochrome p450 [Moniliophthora roreri MCA 2997]